MMEQLTAELPLDGLINSKLTEGYIQKNDRESRQEQWLVPEDEVRLESSTVATTACSKGNDSLIDIGVLDTLVNDPPCHPLASREAT